MTIPGNTSRASQPKALGKDKHTHDIRGEDRMKKGGEGGGAASELDDEIAAQQDAQRDAEAAIAEGDEHPGVQSFEQRSGEVSTSPDTGSLSEDYANKEGGLLARMQTDPNTMDLNEIARSSGSVSHPTADTVSSGTDPSLVR